MENNLGVQISADEFKVLEKDDRDLCIGYCVAAF